jgi:hypothetical protein
LEGEREKNMEEMFEEQSLEDRYENKAIVSGVEDEHGNPPIAEQSDSGKTTRKTGKNLKSGEALEVYNSEMIEACYCFIVTRL